MNSRKNVSGAAAAVGAAVGAACAVAAASSSAAAAVILWAETAVHVFFWAGANGGGMVGALALVVSAVALTFSHWLSCFLVSAAWLGEG